MVLLAACASHRLPWTDGLSEPAASETVRLEALHPVRDLEAFLRSEGCPAVKVEATRVSCTWPAQRVSRVWRRMSIQIDLGEDTAVIQPLPETCERSDGGCTASDRMSFDEGSLVYISKSILTGHDIGAPGDYPPYYGRDRRR